MTIKEYREFETKINEEINKLKDKLVKAEKQVNFGIPFSVLMEELQKVVFLEREDQNNYIKHNYFRIMIGSCTPYIFDKNIKGAIQSELSTNSGKGVMAFIECCDVQNRPRATFAINFNMDTKLSDGTLLVDSLKLASNPLGYKIITMDEKDIQKVIIDMSPSGRNYHEISSERFVDTLVEIMESKDKAQEYVEQIKAGKRKNPAIEPGAYPPSEGVRAENGVIDVYVNAQSEPIVEACVAQSSDTIAEEEDDYKKPVAQTDESIDKKKKIQRIAEIIEGVKQKKIASDQNYEIGGRLVAAISKTEVIKMVREKKIANGEKLRPDYPANEKEMAEVIAYSLQYIDEIKNKSSGNVM